jgi:hypothetical protein
MPSDHHAWQAGIHEDQRCSFSLKSRLGFLLKKVNGFIADRMGREVALNWTSFPLTAPRPHGLIGAGVDPIEDRIASRKARVEGRRGECHVAHAGVPLIKCDA